MEAAAAQQTSIEEEEPITTAVTRTIRAGREKEYEEWLHGVGRVAHRFPGHMGIDVFHPREPGGREYVLLFRFATLAHLRAWEDSAERREWVERAEEMSESTEVRQFAGIESWFTLPEKPLARPPARWRMAVVSWLAAFPLIQLLSVVLKPLLGWAPPLLRGAVLGAAMVLMMTYVVMPRFTRLFAGFLFAKH